MQADPFFYSFKLKVTKLSFWETEKGLPTAKKLTDLVIPRTGFELKRGPETLLES